jgi:glutamate dehydrogenase (NAD(P)+)
MAWIMDTYSMHKRETTTGVVTGKPLDLGGSRGRSEATGRGCMFVTREALKKFEIPPTRAKVVIQGFGNVGGMAARLMAREGYHIISIIEVDGAVHNENGLDIEALIKHKRETGSILDFPEAQNLTAEEAFRLPCDVLLPAAKENVITSANAASLNCKIICEGANGPTTAAADKILADRGIFVVPDILANAGGVTVSYFEWVQNRQQYHWDEDEVNTKLRKVMRRTWHQLRGVRGKYGCDLRTAAFVLAIERVAKATELRGVG